MFFFQFSSKLFNTLAVDINKSQKENAQLIFIVREKRTIEIFYSLNLFCANIYQITFFLYELLDPFSIFGVCFPEVQQNKMQFTKSKCIKIPATNLWKIHRRKFVNCYRYCYFPWCYYWKFPFLIILISRN